MHLVQTMAYINETPWHGLGQRLAPHQPLEVWAESAGMNWRIEESEVRFVAGNGGLGAIHAFPEQKVLYRSDTKAPLSVVSNRYQVVQPAEILEFYRDLTEVGGFELETAGVLKEGRKLWALARTGQSAMLKGRDQVHGYRLTTGMNMLALLAYAEQTPAFTQTEYDRLYKGAEHSFKIASEIIMKRPDVMDALRKKTDGMDFSDIVNAAPDASKELQKLLSSRQGLAQLPMPEQQLGQAVSVRVIQVRDNRVSTVAGDLRAASEDPSGEGTKRLLLNGKALDQVSDDHITLLTVYRYDDRDVVLFTHACGGSACGFTSIGILEIPAQGMPRLIANRELTINTDGAEPDVRVQPDGGLLLSFEGQSSPQRWRYLAGQLTKA